MSITAMLVAGAASGAASGLMNKDKGQTEVTPKFAEEQKPLLAQAALSTGPQAQLMFGQDPAYLKRMMESMKGMGLQQARGSLSDYLRQIGKRGGGDFGPAAISGMANIYKGISPAVMQAVNAIRAQATQSAFKQAGQWGMISPQGSTTKETGGPGMGENIGAGMLGGLSQGLGGAAAPKQPATPRAPMAPVPNQSLPAAQQGPVRSQLQLQEGVQAARNAAMPSPFGQPIPGLMPQF